MTSVDLLVTEIGRLTMPVGRIDFYRLPVQDQKDFACAPINIVSFVDVQKISVELAQQFTQGKVGRYRWRKSS